MLLDTVSCSRLNQHIEPVSSIQRAPQQRRQNQSCAGKRQDVSDNIIVIRAANIKKPPLQEVGHSALGDNRQLVTDFAAGSALMVFISQADTKMARAFANLKPHRSVHS